MLRRKLLTRIGLLIAAFVVGAVVAISLLQGALGEMERTNRDAAVLIDGVQAVTGAVTTIQISRASTETVANAAAGLRESMRAIGSHAATRDPASHEGAAFVRMQSAQEQFLNANLDPRQAGSAEAQAMGLAAQSAAQDLGEALRSYVAREQAALGKYFRIRVLGLTLAALVMVNVAVLVLIRTAHVVLKPVAALVEGSRELAAERFTHRVVVDQKDEFGELAHAYNRLAEALQANEERKAEALRQLAVTLNHDLNNAMSVIQLQLGLLDRRAGSNPTLGEHLGQIRSNLAQMSQTVASLKNIRRVVLTDYVPGQKMLDLSRSIEPTTEHAA